MIGREPGALDRLEHAPLQSRLAHFGTARRLAPRPRERLGGDLGQRLRRASVSLSLARAPPRRETGHERGRRHHPRAEALEQLHDSVGHAVEIGHGVLRRDLHRERAAARQPPQLGMQLEPGAVGMHLARKVRQRLQLDAVRHGHRLPAARQQHE